MRNKMNEQIEMLTKNIERYSVIIDLRNSMINCNEDAKDCDVCVGIQYAINIVERRLEITK
jgi:hypothetical protein